MTVDRRRHRIRGLLSRLSWPLCRRSRKNWTEQDQTAFEVWAEAKRETP